MTDAPEQIYASPSFEEGWSRIGHWNVEFGWDFDDVEYVRWDVVKSLEAKLAKAVETLKFYADREKWEDSRFVDEGVNEHGVHSVYMDTSTMMKDLGSAAHTTLAELKGAT